MQCQTVSLFFLFQPLISILSSNVCFSYSLFVLIKPSNLNSIFSKGAPVAILVLSDVRTDSALFGIIIRLSIRRLMPLPQSQFLLKKSWKHIRGVVRPAGVCILFSLFYVRQKWFRRRHAPPPPPFFKTDKGVVNAVRLALIPVGATSTVKLFCCLLQTCSMLKR